MLNPRFLCAAALLAFVFTATGCVEKAEVKDTTAEVIYVGDLWNYTIAGGVLQKVVEFKIDNNGRDLLVYRLLGNDEHDPFGKLLVGQKVKASIAREANGQIASISLGEKPI